MTELAPKHLTYVHCQRCGYFAPQGGRHHPVEGLCCKDDLEEVSYIQEHNEATKEKTE